MRLCKIILLIPVCCLALLALLWYTLPYCITPPDLPSIQETKVEDRNGKLLGIIPGADGYRCLELKKVPENLARCLICAEDQRFYRHNGTDTLAIARATRDRLLGTSRSGASTITMQLAKLLNPPTERRFSVKIKEAMQARALELKHSKEEILLAYLNIADFGNQCRGAEAAALYYFGKSSAELNLSEAALLAALVQAPSHLNPLRYPQRALKRRNTILKRMGESTAAPLGVNSHHINAPLYITKTPGRLTLDATLQQDIAAIAAEELQQLKSHNVSQAAVVVIDNHSGELLAAIPAADPKSSRGGQLNGTNTPRSAGSTLKPFVFLQAFGNGAWPGTIMADVPTIYRSEDGIRAPGNYNDCYLGPITIRKALACSQNIPAMEALHRYGNITSLLELLRSLGIQLSGNAKEYGLGLAIGNAHVTLLELTQAYSTLARGGNRLPLHTHLPHENTACTPLLDARHCYQVAHILSDPNARLATFGDAPALSLPFRCAVKTGTSSDFRDNWCCGFTAEYTVGVWVGNFDNSSMHQISGVSGAAPIFRRVMLRLQEHHRAPLSFPQQPEGITEVTIDTRSGTPATPQTPAACRSTELGTEQQLKQLTAPLLDERGRVILDARYAEWFPLNAPKQLFTLDATAGTKRRPAILIPAHGTSVILDPTLPHNGRYIELRATMPAAVTEWSSPTLKIINSNGKPYAILTPGKHTIRATAPPNISIESTFTVEQD